MTDKATIKDEVQNKVLIFLSGKPRTRREISTRIEYYLLQYENIEASVKEEIAIEIVQRLVDLRLINDENYARIYVGEKLRPPKPQSRLMIKKFLLNKGIEEEVIDLTLESVPEESDNENLHYLLAKKLRTLDKYPLREKKQKLVNFALRKGYRYEAIRTVVEELFDVK